ncbi:hypothetical protein MUK42_17210 [Musa troglodytarum]|uniref:Uncharacterized protein n=1 Tax=Musa troglodytarum TaxID=320322 RepID=A0A9E7HCC9_9LILI|nr:hypothetical protein MUK42_17210 [Musa troglodytarum]
MVTIRHFFGISLTNLLNVDHWPLPNNQDRRISQILPGMLDLSRANSDSYGFHNQSMRYSRLAEASLPSQVLVKFTKMQWNMMLKN